MVYHIAGYPLILSVLVRFTRKPKEPALPAELPSVTAVCAAFNEEEQIEAKIQSFLALDYPKDRLKMIVISDDSTDRTNEIVRKYEGPNIELVIQKPRRGKVSGHNLVEPSIHSDYVLSTDANSIFQPDALKHLVAMIESDHKIGVVTGKLELQTINGQDSGEGLYWRYENWLKTMESQNCTILGANGSIYLMRREFFTQMPPGSVDDLERVLHILENGSIGKYVPKAVVTEFSTQKPQEEIGRKTRIISQEFHTLCRTWRVFNPFRHPIVGTMLVSHKLIRWILFVWAILLLIGNALLALESPIFTIILGLQILGYLIGFLELFAEKKGKAIPCGKLFGYLVAMVWSSLSGFFRFLSTREQTTWNTVRD
jgi:cellulose synthase/poly-beta-1,6-N-acetylglucosamine synthase-like glycosyltransferase